MAKCTGVRCPMQYWYKVDECNHTDCPYRTEPMTNADRIRAMSDEELADFFFESPEIEFAVCGYCKYFGGYVSDTPCKYNTGRCFIPAKNEAFKKWLKQPAEGAKSE